MKDGEEGEEDFEWEEWNPSRISFIHHMIAGSAAGLAEHVSVFPIDTLKTHIQCERCGSMSPIQTWNCATRIVGREGIFRLWRGVSATFAGCLPAHAAYFSIFESTKILFGANREGHYPIQAAACGASAAFGHDMCMTPFDTVKQRMQLGYYNNVAHCITSMIKKEGIRAFYLSLTTTLMMNVPYGCVMVAANESARKVLNPSGDFSFSSSMIAGSMAGAIAAALTNPLDVIKTRLQTQNLEPCPTPTTSVSIITKTKGSAKGPRSGPGNPSGSGQGVGGGNILFHSHSTIATPLAGIHPTQAQTVLSDSTVRSYATSSTISSNIKNENANVNILESGDKIKVSYKSGMQVIRHIVKEEGFSGFLRGLTPRMMLHAPAVAISWTTYETVKSMLEPGKSV